MNYVLHSMYSLAKCALHIILNGDCESKREGANTWREIARKQKRRGGEVEIGGPVTAC